MALIHNEKLGNRNLRYKGHGRYLEILIHSYARVYKWSLGFLTKQKFQERRFNGRRPEQLKIPELKLWLACRRAPRKGKKADLVERCEQKSMRYLYRSLKLIQVSAQLICILGWGISVTIGSVGLFY